MAAKKFGMDGPLGLFLPGGEEVNWLGFGGLAAEVPAVGSLRLVPASNVEAPVLRAPADLFPQLMSTTSIKERVSDDLLGNTPDLKESFMTLRKMIADQIACPW